MPLALAGATIQEEDEYDEDADDDDADDDEDNDVMDLEN